MKIIIYVFMALLLSFVVIAAVPPVYPDISCPRLDITTCETSDKFGIDDYCILTWMPDGIQDCKIYKNLCVPTHDYYSEVQECRKNLSAWKKFQLWIYQIFTKNG